MKQIFIISILLFCCSCSKESSNANGSCSFTQLFSGQKIFRPYLWTHYRNQVNIDQKFYYKTDSNLTTFQINGDGTGIVRVKTYRFDYDPVLNSYRMFYKDTSVQMTYSTNETEKTLSARWYDPTSKVVINQTVAIDSFACNMFRTREVEYSGTKIDEYRTVYVAD